MTSRQEQVFTKATKAMKRRMLENMAREANPFPSRLELFLRAMNNLTQAFVEKDHLLAVRHAADAANLASFMVHVDEGGRVI